ncbi:hypothetical protein KSS87_020443 [Heliosperma pusillum]|nr:hypothetical protein KSS87_020443 [Heliosperma pusillum]
MNNKQRREVMGDDALRSVSSALKVVQQDIDSQQHVGVNQDFSQDVDSDDIINEEFDQLMAMERENDEHQYNTDDEYVQMNKETEEAFDEQCEGGSGEDDMDEDEIWDMEVERQLRGANEIIHMDKELITSGKVKKTRGLVYCRKLTALAPGQKIFVEFDDDGNPIGKNATSYAYFLGEKVRNRKIFPVQVTGWEDFKAETLDHLWSCVLEVCDFDNPELRREEVMKHARKLFRGSRLEVLGRALAKSEVQEKNNKAKESRSFQKMPHYPGSKSHARVREDIINTYGTCSRVDLLLETRKRKSNTPVNALNLDYNMKKIEEVNKRKKEREEGLNKNTDDQILMEVLGQDTHRYLRCYGRGKSITQHFGVKPSRMELVKEVVEVRLTTEDVIEQAKNEVLKSRQEVADIRKEAEAAKKEVEAKVDEKIAANNEMWQKKLDDLLKSYGVGPSH